MKLARFDAGTGPRLAVVRKNGFVDIARAGLAFSTTEEIIGGGSDALVAIERRTANLEPDYPLDRMFFLPPIARPGKYLAIGMNYKDHVAEATKLGLEEPKKQFWFNKQTTCITGPYSDIAPGVTEKLDYEVELGVVIGKSAKMVRAEHACDYIFGYVVANDVSARDWQFHTPTCTMGKSFDTHGPIGPWIVTADEITDPHNLALRCFVNGQLRQSSNTSQMIHNIFAQIEYLSTAFTLEPGDLIATGTPEGVGVAMNPQSFLKPGDIVRCEVDGIGAIENRVTG